MNSSGTTEVFDRSPIPGSALNSTDVRARGFRLGLQAAMGILKMVKQYGINSIIRGGLRKGALAREEVKDTRRLVEKCLKQDQVLRMLILRDLPK
jgi:hypothetical protein